MLDKEAPRFLFLADEDGIFILTTEKPQEGKQSIEAFKKKVNKFSTSARFKERNVGSRFQELRRQGKIGIVLNSHPDNVGVPVGRITVTSTTAKSYFAIALRPEYGSLLAEDNREQVTADTLKVMADLIDDLLKAEKSGVRLMSHEEFKDLLISEGMGIVAEEEFEKLNRN